MLLSAKLMPLSRSLHFLCGLSVLRVVSTATFAFQSYSSASLLWHSSAEIYINYSIVDNRSQLLGWWDVGERATTHYLRISVWRQCHAGRSNPRNSCWDYCICYNKNTMVVALKARSGAKLHVSATKGTCNVTPHIKILTLIRQLSSSSWHDSTAQVFYRLWRTEQKPIKQITRWQQFRQNVKKCVKQNIS